MTNVCCSIFVVYRVKRRFTKPVALFINRLQASAYVDKMLSMYKLPLGSYFISEQKLVAPLHF